MSQAIVNSSLIFNFVYCVVWNICVVQYISLLATLLLYFFHVLLREKRLRHARMGLSTFANSVAERGFCLYFIVSFWKKFKKETFEHGVVSQWRKGKDNL